MIQIKEHNPIKGLSIIAMCAALAACGGGGGSSPAPVGNSSSVSVSSSTSSVSTSSTSSSASSSSSSSSSSSISSSSSSSSSSSNANPALAAFIGDIGGLGNTDGTGASARFDSPGDVVTDSGGNIYVADTWNATIRKITPTGVVTTFAGTPGINGAIDGIGTAARFGLTSGLAIDGAGNIYAADAGNSDIRKITSAGVVTALAGKAGQPGSLDGTGAAALFNGPARIAVDSSGNVYVTDAGNNTIRKITPAGVVTTFAGSASTPGSTDGGRTAALFRNPYGIAIDNTGNVYVADEGNNTIRKISSAGIVTTLAGTAGTFGSTDGTGAAARFDSPRGIALDSAGNLYVPDANNNTVRKITPSGVVSTLAGTAGTSGTTDGSGAAARFYQPLGVNVDSAGNVYVADSGNNTIRKITSGGAVTTLAGSVAVLGSVDATGLAARFDSPFGIATDTAGNLYIADTYNYTIRKSTPAGVVTTLAGTPGNNASGDGTGAAAGFSLPYSVATDNAGNVYVADTNNSTIRKITPTSVVTTLAGMAGAIGVTDGIGSTARFNRPRSLAVDAAGNIYVADTGNHTIRKVTPAGAVTTLAGTAGHSGAMDGTGTSSYFNSPQGIAVDSNGNVYVGDTNNHAIRKIDSSGAVATLAGSFTMAGSNDGTGAAARFSFPHGLVTDSSGNIYATDTDNNTIRKVTPAGVVTTIAGVASMQGFVPGSLPGVIAAPVSIAISGRNLYFLNHGNGVAVITNFP